MNKQKQITRRDILKTLGFTAASVWLGGCAGIDKQPTRQTSKPNIILVMADDLGYGDVGYNGNPKLKTPHLDKMARTNLQFERFYAAFPVCSPTRGSCLTGRHPFRYGIEWAGEEPLPREEVTIAEALKTVGYATGHFGKWHVGCMSKTVKQSYFEGDVDPAKYSPPWENGFDQCFSTASMMPTYNPYYHVGGKFRTDDYRYIQSVPVEKGQTTDGFKWRDYYWTGPDQIVTEKLEGDDSKIIMDKALSFIDQQAKSSKPFLSVIWFHTPHTPVVASNEDRAQYNDLAMQEQHWFGAISAMDQQVGRLRKHLRDIDIANNTIVWFCSDNGPSYIHNLNSAGPFRGKKATLWEGGIRVPAILEWPDRFKQHRIINTPCSTSDFYPTLLKITGTQVKNQPLLDGIDIMPILTGQTDKRPSPIAFQAPVMSKKDVMAEQGTKQLCLHDNRYKLISVNGGKKWMLFDMIKDPGETTDIGDRYPRRVKSMAKQLEQFVASCARSAAGKDYQ